MFFVVTTRAMNLLPRRHVVMAAGNFEPRHPAGPRVMRIEAGPFESAAQAVREAEKLRRRTAVFHNAQTMAVGITV